MKCDCKADLTFETRILLSYLPCIKSTILLMHNTNHVLHILEESLELQGAANVQLPSLLPRSLSPACIQRDIMSNDSYGFNFIFTQELKNIKNKCAFGSVVLWTT